MRTDVGGGLPSGARDVPSMSALVCIPLTRRVLLADVIIILFRAGVFALTFAHRLPSLERPQIPAGNRLNTTRIFDTDN